MKRLAANSLDSLEHAVAVLRRGGLVVYPTETTYGLAADATNPDAVRRLLQVKNRPAGKAISVLFADQDMAEQFVHFNDEARRLAGAFLPGPLTIICQSQHRVDPRLESEVGTLGIRISSSSIAERLITAFGSPLTATSANASGAARPYSLEIMLAGLSDRQTGLIDLALDAGILPRNEPSSVVDTTQEVQQIVRAGGRFIDIAPPFHSRSDSETKDYAARLTESLRHMLSEKPLVFALEGDLGAGKTQFAKGVAEALGIQQPVISPTYVLVKEYESEAVRLVHADLWRLTNVQPEDLGFSEYLVPGTVLVVEWAAPVVEHLRGMGYRIFLEPISETERVITLAEL